MTRPTKTLEFGIEASLLRSEGLICWGVSREERFDPASKPRPMRTLEFELIAFIITLGIERPGLRILQVKRSIFEKMAISVYPLQRSITLYLSKISW